MNALQFVILLSFLSHLICLSLFLGYKDKLNKKMIPIEQAKMRGFLRGLQFTAITKRTLKDEVSIKRMAAFLCELDSLVFKYNFFNK